MLKESLVICPVYNEQNTSKEFYQRLRKNYTQDVLFVDDGSTDSSQNFLLKVQDRHTFLIRHPKRIGYGATLKAGFNFALQSGYKKIITLDVDLQHNPEEIPLFLKELFEVEVVLGSRYISIGKFLDIPRERLLINQYISRLLEVLFSFKLSDHFCGFRAYRDSFLKKAHLKEKSYGLSLEILLEIIRLKTSFKEWPVEAVYFDASRKFLDGLNLPARRLLYYLEIISRKKKEIEHEFCKTLVGV